MYQTVERLILEWDALKSEFQSSKTLKDKDMLTAMMYQPWEWCDEVFTVWNKNNTIILPDAKSLRPVAAKQHASA